jgi:ribonucleoside-diphosphate reductase alpha chain
MGMTWSYDEALKETQDYFGGDELAASAVVGKYLLKDSDNNFLEKTPDDLHRRLATEFARIERKFEKGALSEEEIYSILKNFDYVIPQGSPMYGIGNNHAIVSLSNCVVVQSPSDDVSSIMNRGKDLANLFKRRCGVGVDISSLRPDGSHVSNSAGTTTGAWSFADFYSYVCRMIGQNGRRGALMITLDVRHPDIEKFVTMKHDLTKVTGANVSVKISDDFMRAVENNESFTLQFPVDSNSPTFTKEVDAKAIWDLIVNSATKTAEPGLMMWDTITRELPAHCYKEHGFETITTNPCGEIPLSAYDSCRLIAVNLVNFVNDPYTKKSTFDIKRFKKVVASSMRLSDDLVELEVEKLYKILEKVDTDDEHFLWTKLLEACRFGRRTGLGTLGLGDTLFRLGIKYGSKKSVEIIDEIYEAFKCAAYEESINLAKERGPFPVFDWEKEKDNAFIQRLPEELKKEMEVHGRRNISILTNAPTGTCSIAAQTSSGIEPVFRLSYTRRKKINPSDATARVDFVDELGDKWQEFDVYHHEIKNYWNTRGKCKIEDLPKYFTTSDEIDCHGRIEVQAAIQKHVDHSISSTINLPQGTSPSLVGDLYINAWRSGLKGVTIYVDGSRTGVLVTKDKKGSVGDAHEHAQKRPEVVDCEIHRATIKGEDWTILVGVIDDTAYEVFGGLSEYVEIPKKCSSGKIRKRHRKTMANKYDLIVGGNGDEFVIKDIVKVFDNPNHTSFTRTISLALRHKIPLQFLVEQLQKDKEADMFSFSRVVARCLKKYITDGTKASNGIIQDCCESPNIVYQEGCATCLNCGHAKCG